MHQQKPDFKKMTEKERKAFLNDFKKTVVKKDVKKPMKTTYLELNKTKRPSTPKPVMNNNAVDASIKKYQEHVNRMVTLGFSDPSKPSFRNNVVSNMKNLYNMHPKELVPMYNTDWIVDSIVQKVYAKKNVSSEKKPEKTMVKASDTKKTKQMFEARRKAMADKKKKVVKSVNEVKRVENRNNGFDMNASNDNRNNNNVMSNNNSNNMNNMKPMSNNDVKKLMNDLKRVNMSVVRV